MTLDRNELGQGLQSKDTDKSWPIDYKRIVSKAVRYWYVIVVSVLLTSTIAYLYNRYAVRVYPVTASVIVKEVEGLSGGDLLYNNSLVNFRRNYLNETYIIKSYPLIQKVLEDLNFDIAFYKEGNVVTTEAYEDLVFIAFADRDLSRKSVQFMFKVLNGREFELKGEESNGDSRVHRGTFGDTLTFNDFRGVFAVRNQGSIESVVNTPYIFRYVPASILANSYVQGLNISWAEQGAGVLNLSIRGPSPQKGIDFLSGLIQQYQDHDLQNKNETASRTVDFISRQLGEISDSLRRVEYQLQQFKDKNVVTDLSGEALRLYGKVEALEGDKAELIIRKNYYKYLTDYVSRNENLDQIILPSSIGITDPILTGLVSRMTEIQLEINMSRNKENPLVSGAKRSIDLMRKDIVESVKNQESTDEIKIDFINKQIQTIERQLGRLPLAQRNLVSIQRNYSLMENLYIFLLQKHSEASISKAANTSDITVVNPPKSGSAVSPNTNLNYVIGLSLGLILPLLGFILIEIFNDRIQSKEDIERFTSIPFIGGVGHKSIDNNLQVLTHPKTAIAESFRALRSNLNYFIGGKEKAVFMITSSISGEGKTFASINLASVLALSGKATLIIGADMRKPRLFGDFGLTNDVGLSTYLAGLGEFDDVLQTTSYDGLALVSGGPVPPNPSELLLTDRMMSFMQEATKRFDYIILDTPPLAIVTDAFVLAPYADHTLFVVRQNYTPRDLLKTAEDFFSSGKLKNISIVFNDIRKSGPGYGYGYGYNYGYGYGYGYASREKKGAHGYYEE